MASELLMGNHAIAAGAIMAGVGFVSGYPGTPSTEVLETVAKRNTGDIHVEWSVNEKAALEAAAGAAIAGVRSMVTMKQVGLNVASDPLMSLSYIGVKGGMVVVVADDPGPISSQTEQDTRTFAAYGKLPVFDPSSPEEAFEMTAAAFELSEKYGAPVILRPTTRVCHGYASIDTDRPRRAAKPEGFIRDKRWVIFPRLSYNNHLKLEQRREVLAEEFSACPYNTCVGGGRIGIAAGGISRAYTLEALDILSAQCRVLNIGTPYPFPERLAADFLSEVDEVLVLEELDPVIERELIFLCGKLGKSVRILGKLSGDVPQAGELSAEIAVAAIAKLMGATVPARSASSAGDPPPLPVRPPVLCAGCPHRASFYAVKKAMSGRKAVFSGDIGCYTLGNAMPLDMVDTCLCMGAGITMAQGLHTAEPDAVNFAFVGDSTFFASGMTGVLNAVYNQSRVVIIILDNSTTAMTGHQPHPGTGVTMMGHSGTPADIEAILKALGVGCIKKCDPLKLSEAVGCVTEAAEYDSVSAVIFKSPCVAIVGAKGCAEIAPSCIGCGKCVRELGCPAISISSGKAVIEPSMCTGCGLCAQVCPLNAIGGCRND